MSAHASSSDKTVQVECPNCGRAHDTYRQRPTDWCPTCYREWLNNYPQNVNHFYATLFEKEENRDHRTGASFHAPFTPQNNRSMV